jgi:hypothetical protein
MEFHPCRLFSSSSPPFSLCQSKSSLCSWVQDSSTGSSYAAPSSSYDARSSYDYRADESYEGEYRALQDNLLAAQNDNLEDRDGELGKRIGNLVAPVAQKLGEAASKMIQ